MGPVATFADTALGQEPFDAANPRITLGLWVGGNLLIASMIPVAGLLQWVTFGVRPGRLSSVVGRFRWRWLAEVALIFVPLWLIFSGISLSLSPVGSPVFSPSSFVLAAVALVTIPLQAAGEEYLFRGLLMRAVGALFSRQGVAVIVAIAVTSVGFTVFHAPSTGWALTYYLFVAVCFSLLTHLTGGLEASVLAHATGNVTLTLPILFSGELDELTATSGPLLLLPMVAMGAATVLIWWRAKRRGYTPHSGDDTEPSSAVGLPVGSR